MAWGGGGVWGSGTWGPSSQPNGSGPAPQGPTAQDVQAAQDGGSQPYGPAIGLVDLDCPYGGSLKLTPQGDVALVQDTPYSTAASEQYVQRLILTNPTLRDTNGNAIGRPDDLFNPGWGSGARASVGENATSDLEDQVRAQILDSLQKDPFIAPTPVPNVELDTSPQDGSIVIGTVTFTTLTGQIATLPSNLLEV